MTANRIDMCFAVSCARPVMNASKPPAAVKPWRWPLPPRRHPGRHRYRRPACRCHQSLREVRSLAPHSRTLRSPAHADDLWLSRPAPPGLRKHLPQCGRSRPTRHRYLHPRSSLLPLRPRRRPCHHSRPRQRHSPERAEDDVRSLLHDQRIARFRTGIVGIQKSGAQTQRHHPLSILHTSRAQRHNL